MREIPSLPRLLALLVLLPQLACVAALYFGPAEYYQAARTLAFGYGALLFSFVGGAWWGIAAAAPAAERRRSLGWLWLAAVAPALIAFAALLPWVLERTWPEPSLVMLGGAILMSPAVDAKLGPLAPRWWMALRVPHSLVLGAATLAAALA